MYIYIGEEGGKDLKNDLLISVAENHMKVQKYNPQVSLVGYLGGFIDENGNLNVSKKNLKKGLQERLGLKRTRINTLITTYLELGLIKEDKDNYIFSKIEAPFVGLQRDTIMFCGQHLGQIPFKVYLYLMNKYQLNCIGRQNGRYIENYFFSKREIAVALGYNGTKEDNILKIQEALELLQDLGFLKCSSSQRRQGHNGYYHELFWVNQYSVTHLKSDLEYLADRQKRGCNYIGKTTREALAEPITNIVEAHNNSIKNLDLAKMQENLEKADKVGLLSQQPNNIRATIEGAKTALENR